MDTLRREREKLRKDNASLVAQLNLKAARENRLMEDYFREQVREGHHSVVGGWSCQTHVPCNALHIHACTYMHIPA